ncbi:MAG: response regulator [Nitrospira sp.]|nr:response regulator [Nitrospira sp.]MDH4343691.1 response regulator [Nitrospira sp.]
MNNSSSGQDPLLLLVEDEQDTADLVTLIMKERGYQVLHAADGSVALEKVALMPPPSLVMLDIQLPHIDGITILETIRATPDWENVPVIMLTAVADQDKIKKVRALTVQDYVLKPFRQETLLRSVDQSRTTSARPQ